MGLKFNSPQSENAVNKSSDVSMIGADRTKLASALCDVKSIRECFAGVGVLTEVYQETFHPQAHELWEYDGGCCEVLRNKFPGLDVWQGDSFAHPFPLCEVDLTDLDFNTFTGFWVVRDTKHCRTLLKEVFKTNRYVMFTDTAIFRMYLNKNVYSQALKRPVDDFLAYGQAMNNMIKQVYGHRIVSARSHRNMATFLTERVE